MREGTDGRDSPDVATAGMNETAPDGWEAFVAGYQRGWMDGGSHGGEDAPKAEHLHADYREWLAHR